jgi:hypothetical protein
MKDTLNSFDSSSKKQEIDLYARPRRRRDQCMRKINNSSLKIGWIDKTTKDLQLYYMHHTVDISM